MTAPKHTWILIVALIAAMLVFVLGFFVIFMKDSPYDITPQKLDGMEAFEARRLEYKRKCQGETADADVASVDIADALCGVIKEEACSPLALVP